MNRIIKKVQSHFNHNRLDLALSELHQHIAKCSDNERFDFLSLEIDKFSSNHNFNIWYAANIHSAAYHYNHFKINWFLTNNYMSDHIILENVSSLTTTISFIKYKHGIIEPDEWYDWKYNNIKDC